MRYIAVMCNKCGRYQACEVREVIKYTFSCRRCGHRTKLHKQSTQGIALKHTFAESAKHCELIVKNLNSPASAMLQ